ncbi:MAG TPA: response regulator [Anaerolineae bacterium]|nr:response regulator [Anaerolineae bacterium]
MAGETVLVVDNREDSIKFLRTYVLQPNGYKMIEATDGADALKIALSKKVDLIISDLVMPRMGGLELLEALNHRNIDTPTILMTFHGSEGTAVRAFRLGARDYIIKPFAIDEMLTAIDRALTEARLRQERDALTQTVLKVNQQLESRMQELRFLYGIGRSVTSLRDIEPILNRIVDAAAFLTEAEEGSIMLVDEESGDLYLRAARGLNEKKASSFRIKMHDSIAGQVVKSGQPISIGGQNEDDSFKVKTGYFVKSLLNVPIKNKDDIIGVLAVNNKDTARAFTERHLNLLTALADYASVAIDNASCAAWNGLSEARDRRKINRARTSSWGSSGTELKVISGLLACPDSVTEVVTPSDSVVAVRLTKGMKLPIMLADPSVSVKRLPSRSSRPRIRPKLPAGTTSRVLPPSRNWPPSSASSPRPRTKTRLGASSVRSSRSGIGSRPWLVPRAMPALMRVSRLAAPSPTWTRPARPTPCRDRGELGISISAWLTVTCPDTSALWASAPTRLTLPVTRAWNRLGCCTTRSCAVTRRSASRAGFRRIAPSMVPRPPDNEVPSTCTTVSRPRICAVASMSRKATPAGGRT